MRLIHVALACRSVENADRFYEDLLGLERQAPKMLAGTVSKQIFELRQNTEFPIINYMNNNMHFEIFIDNTCSINKEQVSHICIDVGDLTPFLEKCRTRGVTVRQIPKGDKIVTFIRDFDGNLFEIVERKI